MHRYKELKVWQKSMDLVVKTYELTSAFPLHERYGLTQQITRSAVSIPSNIAEGCGRNSEKELNNFLNIASGSASELETQILIANRINYLSEDSANELSEQIQEVQNMIFGLKRSLTQVHST